MHDLAQSARKAGLPQIALNSIVRAQHLQTIIASTFDISLEFASVLWTQHEEKMAVDYLDTLRQTHVGLPAKTQALVLAQLVCQFV